MTDLRVTRLVYRTDPYVIGFFCRTKIKHKFSEHHKTSKRYKEGELLLKWPRNCPHPKSIPVIAGAYHWYIYLPPFFTI